MRILTLTHDDIFKGHLILINPFHPIKRGIPQDRLIPVYSDFPQHLLKRQAANMLLKVISILGCEHDVIPVSGYRTMQEQQRIYSDSLHERGEAFTEKYVAIPGCSEHQTGLAIDFSENSGDIDFICPGFPSTGICGHFRELSLQYGFIERYPAGAEKITGIAHEPWHFRYVGVPHSEIMFEKAFTLEEYTDYLRQFPYYGSHLFFQYSQQEYELFYIPVPDMGNVKVEIPDNIPHEISGNNVDGVVVTLRRSAV